MSLQIEKSKQTKALSNSAATSSDSNGLIEPPKAAQDQQLRPGQMSTNGSSRLPRLQRRTTPLAAPAAPSKQQQPKQQTNQQAISNASTTTTTYILQQSTGDTTVMASAASASSGKGRRIPRAKNTNTWRKSLLPGDYKVLDLEKRMALVRAPASATLEALLRVGTVDSDGQTVKLDENMMQQWTSFESTKLAYLSKSDFLDIDALPKYREAFEDPSSLLMSVIRLCNLTTFLFCVLSSEPDSLTGARPKDSSAKLDRAALNFITCVRPSADALSDGLLQILVALKCQSYLSACLRSPPPRTPPVPSAFLGKHIYTLLNPAEAPTMEDSHERRQSDLRFKAYSDDALRAAVEVGGDAKVLETIWHWDDCRDAARNYCESVARRLVDGEAIADEESGEEGDEPMEGPTMKQEQRRLQMLAEEDLESETEQAVEEEDEDVMRTLGLSSPVSSRHGRFINDEDDDDDDDDDDEKRDDLEEDVESDVELTETQKEAIAYAASLLEEDAETSQETQDTESQQLRNAALAEALFAEASEDEEEEEFEEEGVVTAILPAKRDIQVGRKSVSATAQVIRIQSDNTLKLGDPEPIKRSILDRQDDAKKIDFDTQPQSYEELEEGDELLESTLPLSRDLAKAKTKDGKKMKATEHAKAGAKANDNDGGDDVPIERGRGNHGRGARASSAVVADDVDELDDDDESQRGSVNSTARSDDAAMSDQDRGDYGGSHQSADDAERAYAEQIRAQKVADAKKQGSSKNGSNRKRKVAVDDEEEGVAVVESSIHRSAKGKKSSMSQEKKRPKTAVAATKKGKGKRKAMSISDTSSSFSSSSSSSSDDDDDDDDSIRVQAKASGSGKKASSSSRGSTDPKNQLTNVYDSDYDRGPSHYASPPGTARKAWTKEETALLISELKRKGVGFNSKKIIGRHGRHGVKSHVLRDRTVVSIKDKARVIANGYAREGKDLPWWLNGVKPSKGTKPIIRSRHASLESASGSGSDEESSEEEGSGLGRKRADDASDPSSDE